MFIRQEDFSCFDDVCYEELAVMFSDSRLVLGSGSGGIALF